MYIYKVPADVDIFAMTETSLTNKDNAAKLELIPSETYNFV